MVPLHKIKTFRGARDFFGPFWSQKMGPVRGVEAVWAESEEQMRWGRSRRGRIIGGRVRGVDANCSPQPPFPQAEFIDPVFAKRLLSRKLLAMPPITPPVTSNGGQKVGPLPLRNIKKTKIDVTVTVGNGCSQIVRRYFGVTVEKGNSCYLDITCNVLKHFSLPSNIYNSVPRYQQMQTA